MEGTSGVNCGEAAVFMGPPGQADITCWGGASTAGNLDWLGAVAGVPRVEAVEEVASGDEEEGPAAGDREAGRACTA